MKFNSKILIISFLVTLVTSLLPQNIYILVISSLLMWGLLPTRKWWSMSTYLLLLFSVFYVVIISFRGHIESGFLMISYLITPVAFYRFGHYLMDEFRETQKRYLLFLLIALLYLLNVFALTIIDISVVGLINESRTLLRDMNNYDALAATLYGLMTSLGIGCVGACLVKEIKFVPRATFICIVAMSLLAVIHLLNRGGLVIAAFCLILSGFVYYKKRSATLLVFLLLICICFYFFFNYSIQNDILDAYNQRDSTGGSETLSAGGRLNLWIEGCQKFFTCPFGWEPKMYAHNMWLDIARVGGWFSFFPFLMVTVKAIKNIFLLIRSSIKGYSVLMLSVNLALILAASIEPVIEGSMLFFSILILIWGMTDEYCSQNRIDYMNK